MNFQEVITNSIVTGTVGDRVQAQGDLMQQGAVVRVDDIRETLCSFMHNIT